MGRADGCRYVASSQDMWWRTKDMDSYVPWKRSVNDGAGLVGLGTFSEEKEGVLRWWFFEVCLLRRSRRAPWEAKVEIL